MLFIKFISILVLVVSIASCGATRWHAIEEIPAESSAYLKDGVFVKGDYIRNATVVEIDGIQTIRKNRGLLEIDLGKLEVKILCDEARGNYNSTDLKGKSKTLKFEAEIQRIYVVRCMPYSHWWIEDLESRKIIAGERPANNY